jgi:hypothetical protein
MPYSFWIEETDYTATGQYEFFQLSSGYLQIQDTSNPGSEIIELPFLWWFSNYSYYYNPWFYWWNFGGSISMYDPSLIASRFWPRYYYHYSYSYYFSASSSVNSLESRSPETVFPEYMGDLRFIKYEHDSNYGLDDFYYLVVPETATDYFTNLDFVIADLDEFDPTVTLSSWEAILKDNYQVLGFTESEVGVCDLATCSIAPTPVPEASSVIGVLAIGCAIIGVALKRKFFPKQDTFISPGAKAS